MTLLLAGGNALGAFEAGACTALLRGGVRPDWVAGVSIGAVNGALVAGNDHPAGLDALRTFWTEAAQLGTSRLAGQFQAMLLGRPGIFAPVASGLLPGRAEDVGLHDLAPLRHSLERLVDFDRLNSGAVRFTAVAVDLETGQDVVFDTRDQTVGPEHIVASCALVPEFRPVRIDGHLLGDGGLSANLPLDVVRGDRSRGGLCIAVDPFRPRARPFTGVAEALARRHEIIFASQTRRQLAHLTEAEELRRTLRHVLDRLPPGTDDDPALRAARAEAARPALDVVTVDWPASDEIGNRLFDYSPSALAERWTGGEQAAERLLDDLSAKC
ncbi:patatin-like phospholipase family protein [Caenispirillum salinarum]|uniref:patatin-like phospholipase family protein n=1 Tax=Caenispirillum salinarum TaxID=859058 RepID=UPI00384CDB7A